MKKLLAGISLTVLSMTVITVNAQMSVPSIGIKGGVNFTGVSALQGNERTSGHGGIFIQSKINKNWAIQPELIYSGEGQHFTNDANERKVLALDYVQIPVMIQYYPVQKFYLEGGPQAGLLVNSNIHNAGASSGKSDVKENYRKGEFALNAGMGINITNHFGLYGRYTQGLTDITKSNDTYRTNSGIELGAAIKF